MPFVKGKSGNPKGRPKLSPITDVLRTKLDVDAFVDVVIEKALAGDVHCIKIIYNRVEGMQKAFDLHIDNRAQFLERPETQEKLLETYKILEGELTEDDTSE